VRGKSIGLIYKALKIDEGEEEVERQDVSVEVWRLAEEIENGGAAFAST